MIKKRYWGKGTRFFAAFVLMIGVMIFAAPDMSYVEAAAEYNWSLVDSDITIETSGAVTRSGNTVTVPYTIGGANAANAGQVSVLILDKEYTADNANGAAVLDYVKLDVVSFATSGTGTYILPEKLLKKVCRNEYFAYIVAEDVDGNMETESASTPCEILIPWEAPAVDVMNFGVNGIINPAIPGSMGDAWTGSYVYFGVYDADVNGILEPVKYRVLDKDSTDFGDDTMLLDSDIILWQGSTPSSAFDDDSNVWADSNIKAYMNGTFLNESFTGAEQDAIADSTKESPSAMDGSLTNRVLYAPLIGEKIFLLDYVEVSRKTYGYYRLSSSGKNRKKSEINGNVSVSSWWLRNQDNALADKGWYINTAGSLMDGGVRGNTIGISPALNVKLSSVFMTSSGGTSKSLPLENTSTQLATTTNTDWKVTLKDLGKTVKVTDYRTVNKAVDGTITVPYTYTDASTDAAEKVNQISVMITDKTYAEENARILYYGALQNIKDGNGAAAVVADTTSGTGTFVMPDGLGDKTLGTDYYLYILSEHVNDSEATDYASAPCEITRIYDGIESVALTGISAPVPEDALDTEVVFNTDIIESVNVKWLKDGNETSGNAVYNSIYTVELTLTAKDGYAFEPAVTVTVDGNAVTAIVSSDGKLAVNTVFPITPQRKIEYVEVPDLPANNIFTNYYQADNVISSTELGNVAEVTLQGNLSPVTVEMDVEWFLMGVYDETPGAVNTFEWRVVPAEYADYDLANGIVTGTVLIQNKDYTPVTITGTDTSVAYDESTIDVSDYFEIDTNAGEETYSIESSTGVGSLSGSVLAVTKTGTFVIKVETVINGVYAAGVKTATIVVTKGVIESTASDYSGTYDGLNHSIKVTVTKPADTTITYSTDGSVYGNSNPEFKNVGTYKVYYKIEKEGYETVSGQKTVTIMEKVVTPPENKDTNTNTNTNNNTNSDANNDAGETPKAENKQDTAATDEPKYKITEGAKSEWSEKEGEDLTFKGTGESAEVVGVKVDGKYLKDEEFSVVVETGAIIIKSEYLKSLGEGNHTLEIVWTDGAANTAFVIKPISSEQSDDGQDYEEENDSLSNEETADKETLNDKTDDTKAEDALDKEDDTKPVTKEESSKTEGSALNEISQKETSSGSVLNYILLVSGGLLLCGGGFFAVWKIGLKK